MNDQIIGLHDWFATPPGRYLLAWESAQLDQAVADIFGYHALQLGLAELDALRANRMPHRWLATAAPSPMAGFVTDFSALPFPASSLDLVVLPHSLELTRDPHACLREVERVLVPEGRVVICGLNPVSLWGLRQSRSRVLRRLGFGRLFLPHEELIGYWRLRDWLRLLGFEVEVGRFGCYLPALAGDKWFPQFAWMERIGERCWPIMGAVYFLVAVKRVRGVTLLSPGWRTRKAGNSVPASIAGSSTLNHSETIVDSSMRNPD